MKLSTVKYPVKKKTLRPFVLLVLLALGSVMIAASLFRHYSPEVPGTSSQDTIQPKRPHSPDSLYKYCMKSGDSYVTAKEYEKAISEYEAGLKVRPKDAYATDRLEKARVLLQAKVKADLDYVNSVSSGDKYFQAKDYLNAKASYQLAIDSKPEDAYARGKLKETMDLLRSMKASNILYDVTIASAEKLLQQKEYEKAMADFESASKILPNEKYPRERINEIIKIMVDSQTKEEMYSRSIAAADKLYNSKGYQNALLEYQHASSYKPDEQYPKDRIRELTALLATMKTRDEAYKKSIAIADKLFDDASYNPSRSEYQNASKIKPEENYPVSRIAEIDKILAGLKKEQEDYNHFVNIADSFYVSKKYVNAKSNYQQALNVKPNESYPKEMIAKADNLLAGLEANSKAQEEAYQAALSAADKFYAAKVYDKAKSGYQNALSIKPDEQYPKDKIKDIDDHFASLEKQKQLEKQYMDLIAAADKLLADKSYVPAKTQYQSALTIKPDEKYPKDRINEIDLALGDLAKQKALDDQYAAAIARADKSFAAKSWELAKTDYTAASVLKPNETYPKDKIADIEKIMSDLANQKQLDDKYNGIVANADKLFQAKTYTDSRAEYVKAGDLKPAEAYPKSRIDEIDRITAALVAQKSLDEQYKNLIDKADKLYADKSYAPAKTSYQDASALKPAETYPKGKIAEINYILEEIAKKQAAEDLYKTLIANGDKLLTDKSYAPAKTQYESALKLKPDEKYPRARIAEIDLALDDLAKQKALDDQYTAAISKADKSFAAKTWEQAKTDYTAASVLKPNETYPKDKMTEIDKVLAGIADQKVLDEKYKGIIANADKLLLAKSYPEARTEYGKAGDLKPDETYPKTKIAEIDNITAALEAQRSLDEQYKNSIDKADKLLADKSYEPSKAEYQNASTLKPAEAYPKGKITEINALLTEIAKKKSLDDQYTSAIADADKLLADKSYEPAKSQYQKASQLKPEEKYPKDKIAQIDLALAEQAKQKALDDQYSSAIAKADNSFSLKSWSQAKTDYNAASALKPNEAYPKDKLVEIDKIIADLATQKALDEKYNGIIANADKMFLAKSYPEAKSEYGKAGDLKPAETYPKSRIAEIDKLVAALEAQRTLEEQYKSFVARADKLLADKSYEPAKSGYEDASKLKPDEQYPKAKIAAIEQILGDLKAFEDKYNGAIATGDTAFGNKSYTQAKSAYQTALVMKPAEKYPKDRIAEIEKIVADQARQKGIDDQYRGSVAKADKLMADKSYALAKTEYTNASSIKPAETYPKDQIAGIDRIVADLKAKDDSYKASIAKANQLMVVKSYLEARTEYQNASEIKPSEQYPKDKIAEINRTLTEMKGKKETFDDLVAKGNELFQAKDYYKSKDNYQQALTIFPDEPYPKQRVNRINAVIDSIYRANKGLYDKAVADGDRYFNAMVFDKAVDSYQEALSYLPMEQYPKDMIAKIRRTIAENAIVDVVSSAQTIANGVEKQFTFVPVNVISRKNNYLYIKIRNLSDRPFSVMLRYGKDKQTNGGAVIKNITGDGNVNERLVSVREQDPWYRNDNNWISLYPQGGDVEVTFIQISRSGQ